MNKITCTIIQAWQYYMSSQKNNNTAFSCIYGPDPNIITLKGERLVGKTVYNKVFFKATSHERGYQTNCLSNFNPVTIFCCCCFFMDKCIKISLIVKM